MKLRKFYLTEEQYDKLGEINADLMRKGINITDERGVQSKAAAVRYLIDNYNLPSKPKGITPKIGDSKQTS